MGETLKMKRKKSIALLCAALLGIIIFGSLCASAEVRPVFYIYNQNNQEKIQVYDAGDGNNYVFLPAYADIEQMTVSAPKHSEVMLNNVRIGQEMPCHDLALETPYELKIGDETVTLWFYQSQNIPALHIDTETGSMKKLLEDKEYEEAVSISLYTAEGKLDFEHSTALLTGRGNTTWTYNKRPYTLKLLDDGNLLNMGNAKKWVLLANAADQSHLNNKLIFDLAKRVGMEWSPEGEYVDVYFNGEYHGLYLLAEKVEIGSDRLDIQTDEGEFLCEMTSGKVEAEKLIKTSSGRNCEVHNQEMLSTEQMKGMASLVDELERVILSDEDLTKIDLIDLDSWVCRYIIDEIAANVDSDRDSSYFYFADGQFHAGPVWDYDKGFGNCQQSRNPWSFVANNYKRSEYSILTYYHALYQNQSFQKRVREIFNERFLPVLEGQINDTIDKLTEQIQAAERMDHLRWENQTPLEQSSALIRTNPETVKSYINERVEFLKSAWIDGKEYCTVQFDMKNGWEYVNYAVEKGLCLSVSDENINSVDWINAENGEQFDFKQPIKEDLVLTKSNE